MSFDTLLDNRTPFDLQPHVQMDADGQEVYVVLLSASFIADAEGRVGVADEQLPVTYGDVPWGDPARSSVRHDADIAPVKPVPEVILNASAHAPGGRPVPRITAGLQIGSVRKLLEVTGDRTALLGGYSDPVPFAAMPIVWERAFGGSVNEGADLDPRNPAGIGHAGARSADPEVLTEAPNITRPGEAPVRPGDRAEPAGFSVVARWWRPRLNHAGTYDAAWLATQWPLPPADFDPRHHQAAPEDQQSDTLRPGATAVLVNLTPEGRWEFRLPRISAPVRLLRDSGVEEAEFRPDTILIEPDLKRITYKARMSFVSRRNVPRLREIIFGHVSPVFLNARRKRKTYIDPLGGDGTRKGLPVWEPA